MSDIVTKYREITRQAQTDPEYRKNLDLEKYMTDCRIYAPLIPKSDSLKIAILGYGSDLVGKWDPFNTTTGLPGSEECAVYASQELANRGYSVTMYMDPPNDSIWKSPFSNPRCLSVDLWNVSENTESYDLVLMWRRFDVETGRRRGKTVFFWPHDSPPDVPQGMKLPPFPKFDGVCILSEHHRLQFSSWPLFYQVPYIVCGNGIVPEQFSAPMSFTNPYSIGYFSNYSRGLIILMLIWPDIRKEFPEATLDICYGRETWNTMPPEMLQFVINKIQEYKSMGVTEHGKIGHLELAHVMQHTSVWSYPCIALGETFCITASKCQAAGCIPVTTRIAALNETVHKDAPHLTLINGNQDIPKYKDVLLSTLRRIRDSNPDELVNERRKYIEFGRSFSWSACIDKWLQLYHKVK